MALGLALLISAAGCTILHSDQIDYKSAGQGVSLEVPPDLTQLPNQSAYTIPGGPVTASGYAATQKAAANATSNVAPNKIAGVQYMRNGDERWLHVNRPPDKVWGEIRDFWVDNGFLLTIDNPVTGIMETDWAENRAKIPQDIIRRTIGKVFDSLYSTGERDRFRTRVEESADGGTDIYITHQGMKEVVTNQESGSTTWEPRPRDRGLEAEFLRRLMVKLGVSQEQAKTMVAQQTATAKAEEHTRVITVDGAPAVQMDQGFDQAWRRVGLSLDRTGFTVEDRDRSKGLYYVRYVNPDAKKKEPGFFSKLFGGTSAPLPTEQYQILVQSQGQTSLVKVQNRDGTPAALVNAEHITKVLADDLR